MAQALLLGVTLFLAPAMIALAGGATAVAGGAAGLMARHWPAPVRLLAIALAAAAAAMLWSAAIVWIMTKTMWFDGASRALLNGLAATLAAVPTLYALRELPQQDILDAVEHRVERPALLIAAALNAIFLAVVLA